MKAALIGYGSMGKLLEAMLTGRGHEVVSIVDPVEKRASAKQITKEALRGAEVAIDFSHPSAVEGNIKALCASGTSAVVGTTGWYGKLDQLRPLIVESGIGFFYSPNFSVGVYLYLQLIEEAAKRFNSWDEYDVWGHEIHHHNKSDSPSGTAKAIERIVLSNVQRKSAAVEDKLDRKIEPHEFHFSSTRGGSVNFEHTLAFDSAADTVSIKHSARNRNGYAAGAVRAAEWVCGKRGVFTMDDMMKV